MEAARVGQSISPVNEGHGKEVKVALRFISVGCNRLVNAAAWGRNNLLAYGAHNVIALYAPEVPLPTILQYTN